MKKIVLAAMFLVIVSTAVFAQGPKYFAFEVGASGSYAVNDGTIGTCQDFGFTYQFDDMFGGGFNFISCSGLSIDVLTLRLTPIDKLNLSVYMGQVEGVLGFGAGVGYDFFVSNKSFFSSLGVYLDWYAGQSAATFNIATGGVFCLGLKTKVGI